MSVDDRYDGIKSVRSAVKSEFGRVGSTLVLFLLVGFLYFPIGIFLISTFKSGAEIRRDPMSLPSEWQYENYILAWTEGNIQTYFLNSVFVVALSLILITVIACLAAYAFVQFDFRAKTMLLIFIVAGLMIPTQVLIVPLFTLMNFLNLLNTFASLIITYVAFAMPFSIFLIRQFFIGIPDSYAEAARLDGASELQIFYRVYVPLSAPALAALAIYQFVFLWNEFLYVITFISRDDTRTLPAGLLAFQGRYTDDWPLLFAAIVIAVLPTVIFIAIFQRYFIRGITMGMGKG